MSTTRRSLILSFAAIAAVAQPTDTAGPGALQFREWLRHFNLGDENAYREYLEKHFPHRFEEATGEKVVVLLREREGERFARAEMKFESPDAVRIARLRIQPTARPDDVPAPARLSEPDAVAALKAKAAELAARDRFSGAVLLGKDGKVLYREAFGKAA